MRERTNSLTDSLFSLEEPWRSRFLTLLANRARGWRRDEQLPTREEVATWLDDQGLCREVELLLSVWRGSPT
jgi:hypothetical protein